MKERPILFSAPMVRALLDGSKTQTRRIIKGLQFVEKTAPSIAPYWRMLDHPSATNGGGTPMGSHVSVMCLYGQPGDRLWVRETWMPVEHDEQPYRYRATNPSHVGKWKPSIFMPRAASRIALEIVSVRVERLQDISGADALAEGISERGTYPPESDPEQIDRDAYRALWESINGAGSWDANPWVWVIEFQRVA